jgi:2-methylisocitrate lyase-like PEP mutase family enzyme
MGRAGAGVAASIGAPDLLTRVMVLYWVKVERIVVVVSGSSVRVGAGAILHG